MGETAIERAQRRVDSGGGWEAVAYLRQAERDRLLQAAQRWKNVRTCPIQTRIGNQKADRDLISAIEEVGGEDG